MNIWLVFQLLGFVYLLFLFISFVIRQNTGRVATRLPHRPLRVRTEAELFAEMEHDAENKQRRARGEPSLPLPAALAWVYDPDPWVRAYGTEDPPADPTLWALTRTKNPDASFTHLLALYEAGRVQQVREAEARSTRATKQPQGSAGAKPRPNKPRPNKPRPNKPPPYERTSDVSATLRAVQQGLTTTTEARARLEPGAITSLPPRAVPLAAMDRHFDPLPTTTPDVLRLRREVWWRFATGAGLSARSPEQYATLWRDFVVADVARGRLTLAQGLALMERPPSNADVYERIRADVVTGHERIADAAPNWMHRRMVARLRTELLQRRITAEQHNYCMERVNREFRSRDWSLKSMPTDEALSIDRIVAEVRQRTEQALAREAASRGLPERARKPYRNPYDYVLREPPKRDDTRVATAKEVNENFDYIQRMINSR
jgi:hypothetical protein